MGHKLKQIGLNLDLKVLQINIAQIPIILPSSTARFLLQVKARTPKICFLSIPYTKLLFEGLFLFIWFLMCVLEVFD